jgi:hypothetical protein
VSSSQVGQVEAGSYMSAVSVAGHEEQELTRNVILWLSDIHPESLHVIRVKLVISSNCGEDLLFNRGWAELHC